MTALHYAARTGHAGMMSLLLNWGSDITAKTDQVQLLNARSGIIIAPCHVRCCQVSVDSNRLCSLHKHCTVKPPTESMCSRLLADKPEGWIVPRCISECFSLCHYYTAPMPQGLTALDLASQGSHSAVVQLLQVQSKTLQVSLLCWDPCQLLHASKFCAPLAPSTGSNNVVSDSVFY